MSKSIKDISLQWHRFTHGKIQVNLKCPITSFEDFRIWYTPGVADPCIEIAKNEELVYEYTNKANNVAVVSDGTRVLGLGKIGPMAGMPVMEGKALLFKYLGDVDAFPICLDAHDPHQIVDAVKWISPSFGGINLEDIESPKCYYVFDKLSKELNIPVIHDDRQGTAVVVLAALINALKVVGKKLKDVRITIIGCGAAGTATAELLMAAEANPKKMILTDRSGIISPNSPKMDPVKEKLIRLTNEERREGGIKEALKDADVAIGLSSSGPGIITKDMIRGMADKSIVFALANPVPEIGTPEEAKAGGAAIVATGRPDYPNQVNNSVCFPGIFRGMLDVWAKGINDAILIAAAYEIANVAEEDGLSVDYIIPRMDNLELYPREAAAVAKATIQTGMARRKDERPEDIYESTKQRISRYRNALKELIHIGYLQLPPK